MRMMKTFRIIALILMMTMLLGILAGCGAINREPEPDTTSSELGLFVKGRIIYNAKGEQTYKSIGFPGPDTIKNEIEKAQK